MGKINICSDEYRLFIMDDLSETMLKDENVYYFKIHDKKEKKNILEIEIKTTEELKEIEKKWNEKKILAKIKEGMKGKDILCYSNSRVLGFDEEGAYLQYIMFVETEDEEFTVETFELYK